MPERAATFNVDEIDGTNGFTIRGEQEGQIFGRSVAGAGDVNGDGFVDIIIGAERTDIAGASDNRGRAYVVFGGETNLDQIDGADGTRDGVIEASEIDGSNGFKIDGVSDDDFLGTSVDTAGDVNGDGIDDLIIGAAGFNQPGKAYVIFGRDTAFAETISPEVTGNGDLSLVFEAAGPNTDDRLGFSVSSAGDVNNDGFDDILLGAPDADPLSGAMNNNEGAAYLIDSAPESLSDFDDNDGQVNGFLDLANLAGNGMVFRSFGVDQELGFAVSELGDINGDGFGDFAIGAPRDDPNSAQDDDNEGLLHVVLGRSAPLLGTRSAASETGTTGFVIAGLDAQDRLGRAVAGGGDVNGDGFDDFIVSAPYADYNSFGPDTGEAYVIFGQQQFRRQVLVDQLDGTNGFKLEGLRAIDLTGISVNILGDVNGDGFDDVGVGVPLFDTMTRAETGAFFVVFGKKDGFDPVIDLGALDGDDGFLITGGEDSFTLGRYTGSALGDVNGDGFDDILVGDETNALGGRYTGAAHIIFGQKAQSSVTRIGTDLAQTQNGGTGDDEIRGNDGNDTLIGHEGDDLIFGGQGNDTIDGGADEDRMFGGSGVDQFILTEASGENEIFGGSNGDILNLSQAAAGVNFRLVDGSITLGLNTTTFVSIEAALGSSQADVITGTSRNNFLAGRNGDDNLRGVSGNDQLVGNSGQDTLFGGSGSDTFTYNRATDSLPGASRRDKVMDFEQGRDVFRLENIDADETSGGVQGFTFIERGLFSGTAGELRFGTSQAGNFSVISGDLDGDRTVDFQIELVGVFNLVEQDFIL